MTYAAGLVMNDTWSNIAFSWGPKDGLELYLNGKKSAFVKYPDSLPPPTKSPQKPFQLTVGCRRAKKEVYEHYVRGMLDEFATWQYKIPESEADYFMGGMDPSKLCNPKKHALGCSTDMDTLLKKIDETDMTDIDIAMSTIMHVTEVISNLQKRRKSKKGKSGNQKDGKGTSRGTGKGEDEDDGEEDYDEDEARKRRLKNLKIMIAIVKKLVNKTSIAFTPGVNPEDLDVLYKVQQIVSSTISETNVDMWRELHEEGEDGVELINSVQDWALKKLEETSIDEKDVDLSLFSANMASRSMKSTNEDIKERFKPYMYFPDYKGEKWAEIKKNWSDPNDQLRVSTEIFGEKDKEVSIHSSLYNTFHKIAPIVNSISDDYTTGVFLDSRIISFDAKPSYNQKILYDDPVVIFLEHYQEKIKHGQQDSQELLNQAKISRRECVRWDKSLLIEGRATLGGWTSDGCAKVNTTSRYTTCACDALGMFALMAVIEKPRVHVEPEDEVWVFILRGLGYSMSIIALIYYIIAIATKPCLHDQFHIIRLNLSIAAVGTMLSLFAVDFRRHDVESCRVLSGFIHYFYLVVGCWLSILTHALFKAFIKGIVEGRIYFYLLVGWGLPLVYVGVVVASSPNYGYDDRCMVGPTRGMRCTLACPLAFFGMSSLVWCTVICCNLSSPQIKRIEVVEELNCSTKMLFCVSLGFTVIWIVGFIALLELDTINARGWRRLFQIFNSWLGVLIVFFLGFGSMHFRYATIDKYIKYIQDIFPRNRIRPNNFDYTNGYRFDFKHYYHN